MERIKDGWILYVNALNFQIVIIKNLLVSYLSFLEFYFAYIYSIT